MGRLVVVATPIGNLEDLSPRAARALREADVVFAEDTRTARALLARLGAAKPLVSCFDRNEAARAAQAVREIRGGRTVALVSEAGTPLVSDPGYRVVRACIDAGLTVEVVPGPSAALAALVGAGLATDEFRFVGFPPRKPGARRARLRALAADAATLVLFEAGNRAGGTLADLCDALGDRDACVARELTKVHEEFARGALGALATRFRDAPPRGEVTIVVAGAREAAAGTQYRDPKVRAQIGAWARAPSSLRDSVALRPARREAEGIPEVFRATQPAGMDRRRDGIEIEGSGTQGFAAAPPADEALRATIRAALAAGATPRDLYRLAIRLKETE